MLKILVGKKGKGEELKWEALTTEDVLALATTPPLFGGAQTFVLEGPLAGARAEEFFSIAKELAGSPHAFIFEEEKLLKAPSEKLTKAGAKIETAKVEKKEWKFDQFGVATALGKRDKKALWLGLTQALHAGEKAEALAGLMAWKARQMGDVNLSRELTFMYHDAHRGLGDLELLLERFALKL